jgi:hypothetical protein
MLRDRAPPLHCWSLYFSPGVLMLRVLVMGEGLEELLKKEVRQLRDKAINALVLSIEHFNRPWDQGRTEAVLILLDHAFEMLLKAAIRDRQGKIRKAREKQTIGFDACVRKGLTDASLKFLTDEQALTLQTTASEMRPSIISSICPSINFTSTPRRA